MKSLVINTLVLVVVIFIGGFLATGLGYFSAVVIGGATMFNWWLSLLGLVLAATITVAFAFSVVEWGKQWYEDVLAFVGLRKISSSRYVSDEYGWVTLTEWVFLPTWDRYAFGRSSFLVSESHPQYQVTGWGFDCWLKSCRASRIRRPSKR